MADDDIRLTATLRTEFGKGAARRARRDGNVPAVLYGHGTEPRHLNLPARDFATVLRNRGVNAVLDLDIAGESQLALTKSVVVHPVRNYIEHADLLVVRRGEKVTVDVPIEVVGEAAPGTLVTVELDTLSVEAEALHIPESIEVSVEGVVAGTPILAGDITLPEGSTLEGDPEQLIVNVVVAPTETQLEEEGTDEGEAAEAPAAEDAPEAE